MKKMIEILAAIKGQGAMLFGGALFLYVVVGWWLGFDAVPYIIVVQMGVLSMVCAGLAYICFVVDKKHKPVERVVGFLILMYIILTASAYFGNWFTFTLVAVMIFTGIFITLSAIMFGIYGVYFHITGTRYNQMLTSYQSRHATKVQ